MSFLAKNIIGWRPKINIELSWKMYMYEFKANEKEENHRIHSLLSSDVLTIHLPELLKMKKISIKLKCWVEKTLTKIRETSSFINIRLCLLARGINSKKFAVCHISRFHFGWYRNRDVTERGKEKP